MGAVIRRVAHLVAIALALTIAMPSTTAAFSGFGTVTADATYGGQMRFAVQLPGGPPDRLELLLRFTGSDSTVVAPVDPGASSAEYVWDTAKRHITPNTAIAYRWRATEAGQVTLSPEKTLLYDDDRPGLDWHSARIGAATVHWYGGAEAQARHFGAISADAATTAEALLGHELDGPIDIFVYDSRDDFFGALGAGAREWTGAATYPELRTIFMWLGGGSSSYLETTMTHEVTHVVFRDATANPFHEPATWFNEGLAVWSEEHAVGDQERNVRAAADSGDLLAFDGITESFPIGATAARLAYSEGATMVDMIIRTYGQDAIAAIAAAWRDGASDAEALEAGTGIPATQLYDEYFTSFGVAAPTAVEPAAILPSNVDKPPQPVPAQPAESGAASPAPSSGGEPAPEPEAGSWLPALILAGLAVGAIAGFVLNRRRIRERP
jgi:peptidase MA superfamily protein